MEEFWDQRYSKPGFAYGQEPNDFFKYIIDALPSGNLLLPGEGEGRNAIYAAGKNWDVTAIDQSKVAKKKALDWANSLNLKINYLQSNLSDFRCENPDYDLIALIYIHLPPDLRKEIHTRLVSCLKPGGKLIIECFHKSQIGYGTGGPQVEEMLFSEEDLRNDFSMLEIEQCRHEFVLNDAGKYHSDKASIIRFTANKK